MHTRDRGKKYRELCFVIEHSPCPQRMGFQQRRKTQRRTERESLWDRSSCLCLSWKVDQGSGPEPVRSLRKEYISLTQKHEQCVHLGRQVLGR